MTEKETNQKFLQNTIDFIVENITDNNLNVEGLADALNLNISNVYRKIKALTGLTIIEFIRMVRLKEAIKLIETKKYSISEIAYKTGFTSPSYFTKSFKVHYGKPPSEFIED
jgi:AraC-like DNA-binding protein